MKKNPLRSPYLWAVTAAILIVVLAWVGRERYQPVLSGARAPDFTAYTLDGEPRTLDDFRGKVILLNIWATWCPPCREEMPSMERLYREMQGTDFEIVAVSVDAPQGTSDAFGRPGGDLKAFVEEFGLTFPILHDPEGKIQQIYQTTGVPESFIIGRDGIIYRKVAGATDWEAPVNKDLIRRLLEG
ncbi:MAG: peroxiredoxin family protein [Gemmatimonadota bacterium]